MSKRNVLLVIRTLILLLLSHLALFGTGLLFAYLTETLSATMNQIVLKREAFPLFDSYLALFFVYFWAKIVNTLTYRVWYLPVAKDYPIVFNAIPNVIYALLYCISVVVIYILYNMDKPPSSPSLTSSTLSPLQVSWTSGSPGPALSPASTTTVLLDKKTLGYTAAMSYIMYVNWRTLHKDLTYQLDGLTSWPTSFLWAYFVFLIVQAFVTFLYSIPLIGVMVVFVFMEWSIKLLIPILIILAVGMGLVGGFAENNNPWPRTPNTPPYWAEINACARIGLVMLLFLGFHFVFFHDGFGPLYADLQFPLLILIGCIHLIHLIKNVFLGLMTRENYLPVVIGWAWGIVESRDLHFPSAVFGPNNNMERRRNNKWSFIQDRTMGHDPNDPNGSNSASDNLKRAVPHFPQYFTWVSTGLIQLFLQEVYKVTRVSLRKPKIHWPFQVTNNQYDVTPSPSSSTGHGTNPPRRVSVVNMTLLPKIASSNPSSDKLIGFVEIPLSDVESFRSQEQTEPKPKTKRKSRSLFTSRPSKNRNPVFRLKLRQDLGQGEGSPNPRDTGTLGKETCV